MTGDTIFALSTAPGRGGIAVVRVSGPRAAEVAEILTGHAGFQPRHATLCRIAHRGRPIDSGIVILFQAPASFTGEDVVEFHVHGGRAIVVALSGALAAEGCRHADPGEFTKRAFLNGRIDLTGAEAIADLIDAETEAQQAQALAQAEGGLALLYQGWTDRLTRSLAYLEASLDFSDEDLPDVMPQITVDMAALAAEIAAHLGDARQGERLRTGVKIAILGAPNAGKSSLLNELAGRDIAIVSERAGTTRDVLEVHLNLGGYPVILADTAGIRETTDDIETEGITRARRWMQQADLKLILLDATSLPQPEIEALIDADSIVVWTKRDLIPTTLVDDSPIRFSLMGEAGRRSRTDEGDGGSISAGVSWRSPVTLIDHRLSDGPFPHEGEGIIAISVRTGLGMDTLLHHLKSRVAELAGTVTSIPPTRERHRLMLEDMLAALLRFPDAPAIDLAAEDLRIALHSLGRITGHVDAESLLDVIFRDFCIGK